MSESTYLDCQRSQCFRVVVPSRLSSGCRHGRRRSKNSSCSAWFGGSRDRQQPVKSLMWARFIGQSQLQFSPVSAFLSPSRIQRDTSRLTGALCFRRFSSAPASRLLLLPSLWGYVCEIKQRWKELSKRMRLYPSTIATSSATSMSETSRFKATKEREQNILHAHCAIFILRLFMMQLKPPSIVNSKWWWQVGLCYAFTLNGFGKQRRTFVNTTKRALCPETSRRRHSKCF